MAFSLSNIGVTWPAQGNASWYDELQSTLEALDEAYGNYIGKFKKVSDDSWEYPEVGTEYYGGKHGTTQLYVQRFAATITVGGATQTLASSTSAVDIFKTQGFIHNSTGESTSVDAFLSSSVYGVIFLGATGDIELRLGTARDEVGDSYDILVWYSK